MSRPKCWVRWGLVALLAVGCGKSGPTPTVEAVTPNSGSIGIAVPITVTGTGFSPMALRATEGDPQAAVPLVSLDGPQHVECVTTFVSSTQLEATVPAGIALGTYSLTVRNPIGTSATLEAAYTARAPVVIALTGITPRFGWTGEPTTVTLSGAEFVSTPRVLLLAEPPVELGRVAFIDSTTVTAVVPAGVPVGEYGVRLINPNGDQGELLGAFTVTQEPPPQIDTVSPSLGYTSSTTAITLGGANFTADATVELISATGASTPVTVDGVTGTTAIAATVPSGLSEGNYLVRVTRPSDGAYGDFATFVVTSPAGNPGPWSAQATLPQPRRALGAAVSVDDLGNAFLYAVGGEQEVADPAGVEVYNSVAVSPVSVFARPGTWRTDSSLMAVRRKQAAVFAHQGYLFAAGGFDEAGVAQASVERAKVLRNAGAPRQLEAVPGEAGGLASGAWYYRVSAVVSDVDNPQGETLPSDFAVVSVGRDRAVELSWLAPSEGTVTSYRIYRTPEVNGALGQEVLLAADVTGTTFTDDGSLTPDPASVPKPSGGLGNWVTLSAPLNVARGAAAVAVAPIPDGSGGFAGNAVYLVGGSASPTGAPHQDYEYALLPESGGELPAFIQDTSFVFTQARMEASASVASPANAPSVPAGEAFVYLTGGQDPTRTNPSLRFPTSIYVGAVQTDGSLSLGLISATTPSAAGPVSVVANDYLWFAGGWGGSANYRSSVSTGQVDPTLAPELNGFNNTGEPLPSARYQSAGAYFRSAVFVVGGTSNGSDTLDTVLTAIF